MNPPEAAKRATREQLKNKLLEIQKKRKHATKRIQELSTLLETSLDANTRRQLDEEFDAQVELLNTSNREIRAELDGAHLTQEQEDSILSSLR